MKKKWSTVELLRHTRHDWLNQIQLIKGNLDLNHKERACQIIDDIIIQSKNESHLCNLKMEKVAEQLLTFHFQENCFHLDYEVVGDVRSISCLDDTLFQFQTYLFDALNEQPPSKRQCELYILYQVLDEALIIQYEGEGVEVPISVEDYFKVNSVPFFRLMHYEKENNGFELKIKAKCD
ncbi:MAG TPA: Spo0B domain-containing protein [Massilibacterium sp.]|nr:Spo0B domain-containing protein [Massilibacterium sp.]